MKCFKIEFNLFSSNTWSAKMEKSIFWRGKFERYANFTCDFRLQNAAMIAGSFLDHGGHSLLVEMPECLNVFLLVVGLCLSRSTSLDDRKCWTALFHLKVSSVFMLFLENDRNEDY